MPSFSGVDYLDFDSVLSDEEKLSRNTTRQFVDDHVPDDAVGQTAVLVAQHTADATHLGPRNFRSAAGELIRNGAAGLRYDFDRPLNKSAQLPAIFEIRQRLAARYLFYAIDRLQPTNMS